MSDFDDLGTGVGRGTVRKPRPPKESAKNELINRWITDDVSKTPLGTGYSDIDSLRSTLRGRGRGSPSGVENKGEPDTFDTIKPEGLFEDALEKSSPNDTTAKLNLIPSGMHLATKSSKTTDKKINAQKTSTSSACSAKDATPVFKMETTITSPSLNDKDISSEGRFEEVSSPSVKSMNSNNESSKPIKSLSAKMRALRLKKSPSESDLDNLGKTNLPTEHNNSDNETENNRRKTKKTRAEKMKELLLKKASATRISSTDDDESDYAREKATARKYSSDDEMGGKKCASDNESDHLSKKQFSSENGLNVDTWDDWSTADNIPTFSRNNKSGHTTIGCPCSNCMFWNTRDFNTITEEFEVKKKTKTVKPYLLLKTDGGEVKDTVVIKTMTTLLNAMTDTKRAVAAKILVHGAVIPHPQKELKEVPFSKPIHTALNVLNYKIAKPIQSYGWLAIMKKMHVCLVHSSQTGKTMTYLPAICSFLLNVERHADLPKLNGPIAIILCPDAKTVESVLELLNNLLKKVTSQTKIRVSVGLRPFDKVIIDQFNQPTDILITTPASLLNLLKNNKFNLKRLCYLAVEDADEMLAKYNIEFENILGVTQNMLKHRNCAIDVQLICTAENWTFRLETLMKQLLSTPLIAIGNQLEAALYGRSDMQIVEVKEDLKAEKLYSVLKDIYKIYKPIVICNTTQELADITTLFQLYGIRMVCVDESMSIEDITEAQRTWLATINGDHIVLVTTDEVFMTHLNITNASLLVNYSLPSTWSIFTKRFGYLMDSYKSPLAENDTRYNSKIITFVNDQSMEKFQRIGYFFQKNGGKLPEKFLQFCEETNTKEELKKISDRVNICRRIIMFGECTKIRCLGRHKFSVHLDINRHFTNAFTLKYKILEVVKPNFYIIQPLEYTDFDNNVHTAFNPTKKIEKIFNERRCLELARDVEVNGYYILVEDNKFYRCFVRNILNRSGNNKVATTVEVESIDTYFIKKVDASDLFVMPEEMKNVPPACCKLYITNMVPTDKDSKWSHHAKRFLVKSFETLGYKDEDTFYTSTMRLQLNNIFWADDMYMQVQVENVEPLNKLKLKRFLSTHKMADMVEGSLTKLYNLCKDGAINLPNYDKILEKRPREPTLQQAVPQWAHLMEDGYNAIYFSSAINPENMFVRLAKFHDLLLDLQKSIQKAIKIPHYRCLKPSQVEIGKCYLALDPDGEDYCRVLVTTIEDDNADCFYVDYGDSKLVPKSALKYITDYMISKLPFQAIECKLYGVESTMKKWMDEATDILYNYCFEENTDYFRTLYSTTLKLEPGVYSTNHKYSILLLDYSTNKPVIINNLLIECGFAVPVENEDLTIDFNLPLNMNVQKSNNSGGNIPQINSKGAKDEEQTRFDDDDFDVVIYDYDQFIDEVIWKNNTKNLKNLLAIESQKSPEKNKKKKTQSSVKHDGLRPIVVAPPSDAPTGVLTPDLVWHQTSTEVKIDIKLIGVTKYDMKIVFGRALSFSSNVNGKEYAFKFQLFESVTKAYTHEAFGQVVKISLNKVKEFEWPRLVLSKDVHRHIKYNLDRCDIPDDDDGKDFLNIGSDHEDEIIDNVSLVDIESDIDYSDSDLEISDSD